VAAKEVGKAILSEIFSYMAQHLSALFRFPVGEALLARPLPARRRALG
jgi:hypothetical protein